MGSLFVLFALLGCSHPPRVKAEPDVIVVVLDTLRADHLSQYGYALPTGPGIAPFAQAATRFDAAYAPASWTLPSTSSIVTGLHPLHHQVRHSGDKLPADVDTVAERLRGAGFHTAAFSHNINVSKRTGFDQGFDDFTTYKGEVLDYPHIAEMTEAVDDWVDDNGDDRFFLYLQPMNCHGPYRVPAAHAEDLLGREPNPRFRYYRGVMTRIFKRGAISQRADVTQNYLRSLQEKYDSAVRYSLDEVGRLFERLKAEGLYDSSVIVLTADHGEELFDHGGFSHGYSLHHEVLRVPLFVKLPNQTQGSVVSEPVSLVDLVPTLLDVLQVPATGALDGRSLVPLLHGESLPPRPLVFDIDWKKRCVAKALLDEGWKLLKITNNYEHLHDVVRLYDVTADPTEAHDLAAAEPERVTAMQATLDALLAEYARNPHAAPENVLKSMNHQQLEALGYEE